jgi:hypothetical protein
MRIQFAAFMLAAAAAGLAADASLNGKWKVRTIAAGRDNERECTFAQKNNDLTGTCNVNRVMVPLSGKVDGQKVTWTYRSDSEGGPVTVVFKGTIDSPSAMKGTVTAVEFSIDGEFTATRGK